MARRAARTGGRRRGSASAPPVRGPTAPPSPRPGTPRKARASRTRQVQRSAGSAELCRAWYHLEDVVEVEVGEAGQRLQDDRRAGGGHARLADGQLLQLLALAAALRRDAQLDEAAVADGRPRQVQLAQHRAVSAYLREQLCAASIHFSRTQFH